MIHAVVHPAIERPMTAKYILSYRDKAKSMGFSHIDLPINNAIRVCVSVDIDELFIDKLIKMQTQSEVNEPSNTQFLDFLRRRNVMIADLYATLLENNNSSNYLTWIPGDKTNF